MVTTKMLISLLALALAYVAGQEYGVDCSFPMHYNTIRPDTVNPLGQDYRMEFYHKYMEGCSSVSGKSGEKCQWSEQDRLEMTLMQPKVMKNFTTAGFAKIKAPDQVTTILREYWKAHESEQEVEFWPKENTYVNHWASPTYILPLDSNSESQLAELVRPVLEAWTGQQLILTSIYGIRIYKEGAVLAPHVDRLPLVSSCIINVAQDVDEDWPIEVIAHDGKATNVTAYPGDMILYESHSVIHGRPFALKGRYYASIFVHFEPFGFTEAHAKSGSYGSDLTEEEIEDLKQTYEKLQEQPEQDFEVDLGTPDYVDQDKEAAWRQEYIYDPAILAPKRVESHSKTYTVVVGGLTPHVAAALGNLDELRLMGETDPNSLTKLDNNGWGPIHEAARSGELQIVEYLLEKGANINQRTGGGYGGTPLYWAELSLEKDDPVVQFLKKKGAKNVPPETKAEPDDEKVPEEETLEQKDEL